MADLITDIDGFCETHKLSPTRFGELALKDKPFVSQLRAGRRLWPETEARVRNWMASYAPEQDRAA